MADIILLVFEGASTEPKILKNLREKVFSKEANFVIHATFGTHIYQLWNRMKDDLDQDILEVIKEQNAKKPSNITELDGIERDDVSQIFLFFDYDGHVDVAADDKIEAMLRLFDNETENGKLYISYPMVEALKDIPTNFREHVVPAKDNSTSYKTLVHNTTVYKDVQSITPEVWRKIISANLKKSNFIVFQDYSEPSPYLSQSEIFLGQRVNYIDPANRVAVLSGFPLFIIEYFGGLPSTLKEEEKGSVS